jgi:hypothetical protein
LDAARQAQDQDAEAVAMLALDHAATELETSEQLERVLLGSMAGVNSNGFSGGIFDDPQTIQTLERLGSGSFPIGAIDLGPLSTREELVERINSGSWGQPKQAAAGDVTVPDSARLGTYYGVVPQLRRPLRLLDLIPSSSMDGRSFGYMAESGTFDGAVEVAEGVVKPEGDITLTEAEVVAATIAVWKKMRRQQLADVPSLATTINSRLTYSCLQRLEDQIVHGDGQGENILGIVNAPGVGTVPFDAAAELSDLVLDGITTVVNADAQPDGILINPNNLAALLKTKTQGSGERLDSSGAFSATPSSLWGLPCLPSRVCPIDEVIVGAWGMGTTVFVREAITVRLSDSDQDDFVRNAVTALAELRAGLAIWQATAFCKVKLSASAPLEAKGGGPKKS